MTCGAHPPRASSCAGLAVGTRRNYSSSSSSRASPLPTHFLFRDGVHLRRSSLVASGPSGRKEGEREKECYLRVVRGRGAGIITRAIFHIGTPNQRTNERTPACPPISARMPPDRSAPKEEERRMRAHIHSLFPPIRQIATSSFFPPRN